MALPAERKSRFGKRKWWALAALTLAVLAVGLDQTVLSVALPTLSKSLEASESDLQWFTSGYMLVLAAAMLPVGVLGDRFGRKKVMLTALAVFGLGSAACAYSTSAGEFIAARLLLGLAGAGVVVMALSAMTVLFTEEERPKAVGIWAAANFLALPIGPILGGWLLTHYWWGWVFLLNVPVAVIGLFAATLLLPESRAAQHPGLDPAGIVLSAGGLATVTYGMIRAGEYGWGSAIAWICILLGLAALAGFFAWEHRLGSRPGGRPLVDMALFRSDSFTWGTLLAFVVLLAMTGMLFTLPQYFQGVIGTDAMGSGVRLLPLIAGLIVGAVPADRIARLIGAKTTVMAGFAVLAAGLATGAATSVDSSTAFVAIWTAVCGAGIGLATATAASAALTELSAERSGTGSAVLQALQKTGGPFGAAIMGSILAAGYHARLSLTGLPPSVTAPVRQSVFGGVAVANKLRSPTLLGSVHASFTHGMDLALITSAGIAAAGIVLALLFLPGATAVGHDRSARTHVRRLRALAMPRFATGSHR